MQACISEERLCEHTREALHGFLKQGWAAGLSSLGVQVAGGSVCGAGLGLGVRWHGLRLGLRQGWLGVRWQGHLLESMVPHREGEASEHVAGGRIH